MKRPIAFFDMEVYPNYVLCAFRTADGARHKWVVPEITGLREFVKSHTLITFNGIGFDIPLLLLVLRKEPVGKIKHACDRIIQNNLKWWHFEKEFHVNCSHPDLDHIDLMEVAPLTGGLKLYAAKCHSLSVQDLPYPPETILTPEQIRVVEEYCFNDLLSEQDLYEALKEQIKLREAMSATYGIDLRSKSDAQMAEAIIKSEVEKLKKIKLTKPGDLTGSRFRYQTPAWASFLEIDILEDVVKAEFMVSDKGSTVLPDVLKDKKIEYRGKVYRMGIGGLHSSETKQKMFATQTSMIMDFDVASYYPAIALNQKLYPKHLGSEFLTVYRSLVEKRLDAKKRASELKARIKTSPEPQPLLEEELRKTNVAVEGLKIAINGTFGKLGSKYSVLYSPDLLVQVTVTGQIALLMLIELIGSVMDTEVISANTDGVTVRCGRHVETKVLEAVKEWEMQTGFVTERTDYQAIYSRDVNNYVAIKTDGGVKTKGEYGKGLPLHKNPANEICGDALVAFLKDRTPVEDTIRNCHDIRKFVTVRTVKGGATFQGELIGKIARWYYSTTSRDSIRYACNNYLVPKSEGAMPLIELPMECPEDLDREWYIRETKSMLADLGVGEGVGT